MDWKRGWNECVLRRKRGWPSLNRSVRMEVEGKRDREGGKECERKYGRERMVERETGLVVRLERGWKCEGCTSCKREINKLERPIKSVPAVATNSLPFTRIHLFSLFLLPPSRPARIREGGRKIMPVPWPLSRAELRYWVALLDALFYYCFLFFVASFFFLPLHPSTRVFYRYFSI